MLLRAKESGDPWDKKDTQSQPTEGQADGVLYGLVWPQALPYAQACTGWVSPHTVTSHKDLKVQGECQPRTAAKKS